MTVYQVQHIFHHVSGLPEDDIVNTLHFADGDGPDVGTAALIAGHVAAAFYDAQDQEDDNYLEGFISNQVDRSNLPTIKVYDAQEPGPPLATATAAGMRAQIAGASPLPTEVALVGSFHADLTGVPEEIPDDADPGTAKNRPASSSRNRIYVGPLNSIAVNSTTGRPVGSVRAALLNLFSILDAGTEALRDADCNWCVYSKKLDVALNPVGAWSDDAFDTQRRRGVATTSRSSISFI